MDHVVLMNTQNLGSKQLITIGQDGTVEGGGYLYCRICGPLKKILTTKLRGLCELQTSPRHSDQF